MFYIFLIYSIGLLVSLSILNYLSYKTIRDKVIILQSIVFNTTIIAISVGLWNMFRGV